MIEPTVFVIDDDTGVRKSIRELLISVGLTVETFESAQSFLDTFDAARPAAIAETVLLSLEL